MHDDDDHAGAARSRGRPRIADEKRRNHRVVTFVTEAEFQRLQQLAEASDRAVSFIVHQMIEKQIQSSGDPIQGPGD